jgi:putative flavoprotein involved in K+ transport
VVVVGAGQAGLAIGYFLKQHGRDFTILEAGDAPAAAWRARWDSLKLFTPVRYDSLPGRAFPGDPNSYPGRDDVVAYLTDYARAFELPLERESAVRGIRRADGEYLVELHDRTYAAEQVVIATGPFQVPRVPPIAHPLDPSVVQFHSTAYRRPDQLPAGPVLVVRDWTIAYWEATLPYSAGGAYVNFLMDEGRERVQATYGDNYDRLARIKASRDPDNVFHVNQNIAPRA